MQTVYIVHGWDGSPKEPMLQWLKKNLEKQNYKVEIPAMPDAEKPKIIPWTDKINQVVTNPQNAIFIGHSIGCQAVLRFIEALPENTSIGKLILIAPWMELNTQTLAEEGEAVKVIARPWMETPIDFTNIKNKSNKITAIFSDNDPYVPLSQSELFSSKLGAKIIVEHNKGHFDPDSKIDKLPSALFAVLDQNN